MAKLRYYAAPLVALALVVLLAIWAGLYQVRKEDACKARGGEPVNLRGKVICFEKGILK